ncbi:hypothetical protein SASPL_103316 [Salvia splendens]|uniref:Xrn1 helical domain-containing protein n=1 Tax=Salvia splendens TaxID=180675 RepID=A0A8X8YSW8_SALSN|nr:hypothetical protein SASPL_103316 [Salvia splendens]
MLRGYAGSCIITTKEYAHGNGLYFPRILQLIMSNVLPASNVDDLITELTITVPIISRNKERFPYRKLMTDQASPILDLYPTEFDLDLNGRKQAWKDVERRRNTLGVDQLFINISHPLAAKILTFWERNKDHPKLQRAKVRTLINPRFSDGMNGYVYISDKPICPPEIPSPLHDMKTITPNKVLLVFYKLPDLHPHIPRPPEGVRMPKKVIGKHDLLPTPTLWHQSAVSQSRFSTRLVAKTYSSEDRGNAMKRSHDAAMNHSGKKRKRRGGKSKRNP